MSLGGVVDTINSSPMLHTEGRESAQKIAAGECESPRAGTTSDQRQTKSASLPTPGGATHVREPHLPPRLKISSTAIEGHGTETTSLGEINDPYATTPPATINTTIQSSPAGPYSVLAGLKPRIPPLICEQGPSGPSSPTSPGVSRCKRPCPLSVDALQRFNLLSPNYHPGVTMDTSKLSPISPPGNYPTSDIGSSPRSSISLGHPSADLLDPRTWNSFRDTAASDNDSVMGSRTGGSSSSFNNLLSPNRMLSPAPFSPFSDYLHYGQASSLSATPFSSRSPDLSPLPTGGSSSNLHFNFEQLRSRSSMSTVGPPTNGEFHGVERQTRGRDDAFSAYAAIAGRSRSEGAMMGRRGKSGVETDVEMQDLSAFSVPTKVESSQRTGSSGTDRKRLHRQTHVAKKEKVDHSETEEDIDVEGDISDEGVSVGTQVSRQPTIEEPPPSPTFAELFQSKDLTMKRQAQVEEWIRSQAAALEVFRNTLIPLQATNHLQVPAGNQLTQLSALEQQLRMASPLVQLLTAPLPPHQQSPSPGPMRPATLWRRCRSESDVTRTEMRTPTTTSVTNGSTSGPSSTSLIAVPINDATCVCDHCGQGFAMHDRLAKHIASRHRDRSASMNDENGKVYQCTLCTKSFGRSDMLTRHLRLHSGLKPYACQQCGQVFSRSDHLSTHQRTHTGEKPYRCPFCNYSASRRDMITRHMKTHLGPEGMPLPFNHVGEMPSTVGMQLQQLQIPPIGQLSLTSNSKTPEPSIETAPAMPSTATSGQSLFTTACELMRRGSTGEVINNLGEGDAGTLASSLVLPPLPKMSSIGIANSAACGGTANNNDHRPLNPVDIAAAAVGILSGGNLTPQLLFPNFEANTLMKAQLSTLLQTATKTNVSSESKEPSAFKPPNGRAQSALEGKNHLS